MKLIEGSIKALTQIPLDIGRPLEFQGEIGNISTSICLDTGAGASSINEALIKKHQIEILDKHVFENPIKMEVGDSREITITYAVLSRLKAQNQKALVWWLVNPNLPVPALIGRPTAERIKMFHNTNQRRVVWEDPTLPKRGLLSYIPKDKETLLPDPPQPVFITKTTKILPRTMVKATIHQPKCTGPQAYFAPYINQTGTLLLPPGLIEFNSASEGKTTILIINPTSKTKKIKGNTKVGFTQAINDQDANRTELIELSNQSLTETRPLRKTYSQRKIPLPKETNIKVGINYFKALPDRLFTQEERKRNTISPKPFEKVVMENPTKEYLNGYLQGINKSDEQPDIQDIISLFTLQPSQQTKSSLKEHPPEIKEVIEKFKLSEAILSDEQRLLLAKLLLNFKEIWDDKIREGPIQHVKGKEHKIQIEGNSFKTRLCRTTSVEDYIIWEHIEKMAKRKVIRPSASPWASPILLADKKNGKVRFCIDYRKLNSMTKQDTYPLPRMDKILASLGKASFFSALDLTDVFWSIRITEEDIEKTAFTSKYGLWEFISMPFGLTNAPATQQRFIEAVLNGLLWTCCFAYIDDILCYSNTFKDHLHDLEKILQRLQDNNLLIQPQKCAFCQPTFSILGFIASKDGLQPDPKKVQAIQNYPYPTTTKETESFLGMISWLRKFIPKCSHYTIHLRKCASEKTAKFRLTDEARKEVDLLKKLITSQTCMAHPNLDQQFYIHVDASKMGLGAILTQTDEKSNHRVIEYTSKTLTTAQQNYSNPVREALGVLWALQHFRYYVHGRNPIIYCDCRCLSDLLKPGSTKIPEHISLRDWIARILHYSPKLIHRPGKMMAIPDSLSRHYLFYSSEAQEVNPPSTLLGSLLTAALNKPEDIKAILQTQDQTYKDQTLASGFADTFLDEIRVLVQTRQQQAKASQPSWKQPPESCSQETSRSNSSTTTSKPDDNIPSPLSSKTMQSKDIVSEQPQVQYRQLALEQRTDPRLTEIIEFLMDGKLPPNKTIARYILSISHQYTIDNEGILRKIDVRTPKGCGPPAILPRSLWDQTIKAYHDHPLSGHRKYRKLLDAMSTAYYFPGMTTYVKAYCVSCVTYQRTVIQKKLAALLNPYYASYPGVLIHLDCTKGSRLTRKGNSHILTIIDSFSGYIRLYPIPQLDSKTVAKAILSYICINSMPVKIVTDNSPEFSNELMAELALLLAYKHTFIAPYNSKGNGKVENAHKTMQTMVRAYIEDFPEDWDLLIPLIEFAMNTSISDVTKYTPFFLHFGRHPIMPLDTLYGAVYQPTITVSDYVKQLQTQRETIFKWVKERRDILAQKRAEKYNASHKLTTLKLGELVRKINPQRKGDYGKKYNHIAGQEIYFIEEDLKNGSYKIRDLERKNPPSTVNIAQLTPIKVRYEIDLHLHNNTISSTSVYPQTEDSTEGRAGSQKPEEPEPYFEIHQIIGCRQNQEKNQYKVWWKGYKKSSAQWIDKEDIDAPEAIIDYHRTYNKSK